MSARLAIMLCLTTCALHASSEFPTPRVVGTPPADAGRGLVRVSATEIRHYDGDLVADQPQFPRLRSDPTAISGASRKKRFPSSPPQGHGLGKTSKKRASTNQFHKSKRFPSSQPKSDGWAGDYYLGERAKLFSFIFENNTSGVIGISGDVHRSDIYKLPIGKERYFYDFTSRSLSRTHRTPPNPLPQEMIHSYGKKTDNNM